MTRRQPAAQAATTVVVARSTSTTTAACPSSGPTSDGVKATCARTSHGLLALAFAEGADLQPQGVEVDEALGVTLPVHLVGLEGREVRPVERARRPPAAHRHHALV